MHHVHNQCSMSGGDKMPYIALPSPNQNIAFACRGLSPKTEESPSWNMLVRLCYGFLSAAQ